MSSDCSSIPDAKFFSEKYTYPEWFSRKKMIFHNKMLKRLKKLRFHHSRASQYYESMNIKLSTPSIVITALSGIASFLSTSQYVDNDSQNACGITVGVLASVASVFQAFTAACQYGAKREAHRTVAEQYNALIVKTKFEMEMPNEEDFIDKLELAILEIDSKCNYFVPQFIIDEWSKEEDKLEKEIKYSSVSKGNLNLTEYVEKDDVKIPQTPDNINTGLFSDSSSTKYTNLVNLNEVSNQLKINVTDVNEGSNLLDSLHSKTSVDDDTKINITSEFITSKSSLGSGPMGNTFV
jgi:hypothetical protein